VEQNVRDLYRTAFPKGTEGYGKEKEIDGCWNTSDQSISAARSATSRTSVYDGTKAQAPVF